jgi:Transglutaminase-like superfamily
MYKVTFVSSLFQKDGADRATSHKTLGLLLETLTKVNELLFATRQLPPLYASGIVYRAEPAGVEEWLDGLQVLARKHADCEDLAAYRAAELRAAGIPARPVWRFWQSQSGSQVYHCLVRYPASYGRLHESAMLVLDNEFEEDPSKVLGMKGAA